MAKASKFMPTAKPGVLLELSYEEADALLNRLFEIEETITDLDEVTRGIMRSLTDALDAIDADAAEKYPNAPVPSETDDVPF